METKEKIEIDWKKIKFIASKECWYIEGSEATLEGNYNEWTDDKKIKEGAGLFRGLTSDYHIQEFYLIGEEDEEHIKKIRENMETASKEIGDDGEGCTFDEFDIYLGDERINDWTYKQLIEFNNN